ncbi:hypothetical protein ACFFU2_02840 [Halomonas alkalicola]|uniref:Uncharacterized protein n=1 Tax=Halomonas alkalicola TaxID=1930622 RepID=A0ABY9H5I7_9GAMM|nr:hypothetical protein [Halomonas alkalicola]WLI73746.1 hypothetical protein B6N23_02055 [Halomonas alkalicola]
MSKVIYSISNKNFVGALLFVCALLPPFPEIFGRSLFLSLSVLVITVVAFFFNINKIKFNQWYCVFWLAFYIFLILTMFGTEEDLALADLKELFIPLAAVILSFLFYSIFSVNDFISFLKESLRAAVAFLFPVILISLVFAFLEYNQSDLSFMYKLYKPYEKYLESRQSVGLYVYPYYNSFFALMCLSIAAPFFFYKPTLANSFVFFGSIVINVLSQSQSGLIAMVAYLIIFLTLKGKRFFGVTVVMLSCSLLFVFIYGVELLVYFSDRFDLYSLSAIRRIVEDPGSSRTLQVRLGQVVQGVEGTARNLYLIGGGLDRGGLLESWLAYMFYKHGALYTFIIALAFVYLVLRLLKSYFFLYGRDLLLSKINKSFLAFIIVMPISQLSAFMVFTHKLTPFFIFIIVVSMFISSTHRFYRNDATANVA